MTAAACHEREKLDQKWQNPALLQQFVLCLTSSIGDDDVEEAGPPLFNAKQDYNQLVTVGYYY